MLRRLIEKRNEFRLDITIGMWEAVMRRLHGAARERNMMIDRRMRLAVMAEMARARVRAREASPERVATAWAFTMARLRRIWP